jgi:hypothetical protein
MIGILFDGSKKLHVCDPPWLHEFQRQIIARSWIIALARLKIRDDAYDDLTRPDGKSEIGVDCDGLLDAVKSGA